MTERRAKRRAKILLSFDIEEFDLPREHGEEISLKEGVRISKLGTERILKLLKETGVRATFFCTGNFAKSEPEILRQMIREGNEVACHGVDHFNPKASDYEESKKIVTEAVRGGKTGKLGANDIVGYRAPRMQKIDYEELKKLGYKYDSSVNPTFIPGRYNNFRHPRAKTIIGAETGEVKTEGAGANDISEIPTSVATKLRIPLFWFSLHQIPVRAYIRLAKKSLKETGYLAVYFHPWEFSEIKEIPGVPAYIKKNSGEEMIKRLRDVILSLKEEGEFILYRDF